MRAFQCGLRKEYAVIPKYADLITVNFGKAANKRIAIFFFEFMEVRAIRDARNNFAAIIGLARIMRDNAVKLVFVIGRRLRVFGEVSIIRLAECRDAIAGNLQSMGIITGEVIYNT